MIVTSHTLEATNQHHLLPILFQSQLNIYLIFQELRTKTIVIAAGIEDENTNNEINGNEL
jgi:hypothetical protein